MRTSTHLLLILSVMLTGCISAKDSAAPIMPQARAIEVLSYHTQFMVGDRTHIAHASAYGSLLSQFDGYIGRNLAQSDSGVWIDITYWRDENAAEKAHDLLQSMNRPELHDYFADMKDKDGKFVRGEIILR